VLRRSFAPLSLCEPKDYLAALLVPTWHASWWAFAKWQGAALLPFTQNRRTADSILTSVVYAMTVFSRPRARRSCCASKSTGQVHRRLAASA